MVGHFVWDIQVYKPNGQEYKRGRGYDPLSLSLSPMFWFYNTDAGSVIGWSRVHLSLTPDEMVRPERCKASAGAQDEIIVAGPWQRYFPVLM